MIHAISTVAPTIGRILPSCFRPAAPAAIQPFEGPSTPRRRQPSPLNVFLALHVILPASVKAKASSGQRRSRPTAVAMRPLMLVFRLAVPQAARLQRQLQILQVTPQSSRVACRSGEVAVPTGSRRQTSL